MVGQIYVLEWDKIRGTDTQQYFGWRKESPLNAMEVDKKDASLVYSNVCSSLLTLLIYEI